MDIYNWTLQNLKRGCRPADLRKYLIQNGYFQHLSTFQMALANYKTNNQELAIPQMPNNKREKGQGQEALTSNKGDTPEEKCQSSKPTYNITSQEQRNVLQNKYNKVVSLRLPPDLIEVLGSNRSKKIIKILRSHYENS